MANFPEENEDGPSKPSLKRQRISSTSGGFSAATPSQETQQHLENENQEAIQQHQESEIRETTHQHQPNENQEIQEHQESENREITRQDQPNENQETQEHLENENRETTRQHQPNENQETQQHESNENQETQLLEANENVETQQHQENENQESSEEEDEYLSDGGAENEQEDDVLDKLSGFLADGAMSMTLMDLDILDCAICLSPLTVPVFQVKFFFPFTFLMLLLGLFKFSVSVFGAGVSVKCLRFSTRRVNLQTNVLPVRFLLADNRCRAIEKVLESVRIPCKNMRYGCGETFTYSKKLDHDKSCIYAPCSCPVQGCDYINSSKKLDSHLRCRHVGEVIRFLLWWCIPSSPNCWPKFRGPPSSAGEYFYELSTDEYFYDLSKNSQGKSFKFQSYMQSIQSRADHPLSAGFVLPPGQFFGTSKMIYLDLIIWRKSDCPLNIQRQNKC
ncbi:E3 UBIQUITIN-PROTEIN LIGASE SINA-LIKE 4 [Salix viminalis]|uniref:E3 UBIQUITIN-PROTEIN LIGASE SINA-LIKE 4 n=1 Tax=Salix viminalis TaxID=40686 RepID=A0A9Q0SNJ7_SALVM|nr:E3 UBIQUITIN-PROTEIN LIGASE SINA-LIKE 4 [Salix viminalis]